MNKIILIGNLTRDPEIRATPTGHTVCSFDIAVNERKGGQDSTTYFRISAWDKIGESCQKYLSKGSKVFAAGPLSARTYQANDGTTRVSLEVNANDIEFLSRKEEESSYQKQERKAIQNEMTPVTPEELPF